jgi:hypothetical protein
MYGIKIAYVKLGVFWRNPLNFSSLWTWKIRIHDFFLFHAHPARLWSAPSLLSNGHERFCLRPGREADFSPSSTAEIPLHHTPFGVVLLRACATLPCLHGARVANIPRCTRLRNLRPPVVTYSAYTVLASLTMNVYSNLHIKKAKLSLCLTN